MPSGKRVKWQGIEFKSQFERDFAKQLDKVGAVWEYEPDKIPWRPPTLFYTPDFKIYRPDGTFFYVETKGYMEPPARTKMLAVKEQHPELDIRFVFMNPKVKLSSKAKVRPTMYMDWAEANGFRWSGPELNLDWIATSVKEMQRGIKSSDKPESPPSTGKRTRKGKKKSPKAVE